MPSEAGHCAYWHKPGQAAMSPQRMLLDAPQHGLAATANRWPRNLQRWSHGAALQQPCWVPQQPPAQPSRSALLGSHASCPGPPCHSQRQLVLIAGVVGQGLGLLGRLVKVLLRGCQGMVRVEMPANKGSASRRQAERVSLTVRRRQTHAPPGPVERGVQCRLQ